MRWLVVVLVLLAWNPPALALQLDYETCRSRNLSGDEAIAGCDRAINTGRFNLAMGKLTSGAKSTGSEPPASGAGASSPAASKLDPEYQSCTNASGDEAIVGCDRAINTGKFSGYLLINLYASRGLERSQKNDLDGAISDFTEMLKLAPKWSAGYRMRGVAYMDQGDDDAAVKDFDCSFQLDPHFYATYYYRGNIYQRKGDRKRAIGYYKKALSLNPSDKDRNTIREALDKSGVKLAAPPLPASEPGASGSAPGRKDKGPHDR